MYLRWENNIKNWENETIIGNFDFKYDFRRSIGGASQ